MDSAHDRAHEPVTTIAFAIEIPQKPVAWQRPRRNRHGSWFTPQATLDAENAIAWAVKNLPRFGEAPLELRIEFRPTSLLIVACEADWQSRLRGDIDNYAKTVLDALQKAGTFENDRQIVRLELKKV